MEKAKLQDQDKELKKLFESYIAVAKHKLGRTPTMEELQKMLSENEGQEQMSALDAPIPVASEQPPEKNVPKDLNKDDKPDMEHETDEIDPKILRMLVYYGMGTPGEDGQKKPDINKILFYEDPKEGRVYDCGSGSWQDNKPTVLDHLPSRPIQFNERDIVAAIVHGVIDDPDYASLEKAGMITDIPRQLWDKTKTFRQQMDQLEKSVEEPEDSSTIEDATDESQDLNDDSDSIDSDYIAGTEESGVEIEAPGEPGEDVLAAIIASAVADPSTGMDAVIRRIVREELETLMRYSSEEEAPEDLTSYETVLD
jgi:hypothetical protein